MSDDLCKHDLAPETCSICLHPSANRKPGPGSITNRMAARFSSTCKRCGNRIEEGDPIGFSEARDEWLCEECFS